MSRRPLDAVVPFLRCPVCGGPLRLDDARLVCDRGHSFDVARQGYVTLTTGRGGPGTGDSAAMVAARERFLAGGHYAPLAEALAALAVRYAGTPADPGLIVDLAGGTGYYLARVLDALDVARGPGAPCYGACLDLSAPALRRAARAHPRAAAIGADAWQPLPLGDGSAGLVMSVFGPRNAGEINRVLAPGGALLIASPAAAHLGELRGPLGIIGIDERKADRIAGAFGRNALAEFVPLAYQLRLDHAEVRALVEMGPSARHVGPADLASRIAALPEIVTVSVDLEIRLYH
jgi:23S rRNA (guanine745-N1)-methyltransferase